MKSLQESLFDRDLVKKDVEIDFDTVLNMLFDFGRKKDKLFDKTGVSYLEGGQSIYIKRSISAPETGNMFPTGNTVCFELDLGLTNIYDHNYKLVPGINPPLLKFNNGPLTRNLKSDDVWKFSVSDGYTTKRLIDKKLNLEKIEYGNRAVSIFAYTASSDNLAKMFKLYDSMVNYFCSDEFKKILQDYVDRFKFKHAIPGVVLDILMKKLIMK